MPVLLSSDNRSRLKNLKNLTNPKADHWKKLSVVLRFSPNTAMYLLREPPPDCVPTQSILSEITASARQNNLTELLAKHLLSGLLLSQDRKREYWPFTAEDIVSRWLPDADPEMLLACSWIFAPILTVQGVTGKECYFVAGIPISTMVKRIRLIA